VDVVGDAVVGGSIEGEGVMGDAAILAGGAEDVVFNGPGSIDVELFDLSIFAYVTDEFSVGRVVLQLVVLAFGVEDVAVRMWVWPVRV